MMNRNFTDIDKNEIIACIKSTSLFEGIHEKSIEEYSKYLKLKSLEKDEVLYQQGDNGDALYIVLNGRLKSIQNIGNGFDEEVEVIEQGNTAGEIASFVGGKRNTTVCAVCGSVVVQMPKTCIRKLFHHSSESLQKITGLIQKRLRRQQLRAVLPRLFGNLDCAMTDQIESHTEWVHLKSGEMLYRQGEEGNSFCIVINGRLAAMVKGKDGIERKVGDITPGECVGEMSMLTGESRTAGILAMRDTELILFSKEAFRQIIKLYPQIMMSITQLITSRLSRVLSSQNAECTVTNIAIVPIHAELSVKDFSRQLIEALSPHGSTLYLNQKRIDKFLGIRGSAQTTADNPYNINLEGWLDQQETNHRFVIYEADFYNSPWSERCLRQSDFIFVLADEEKSPSLGRHRHYLEKHNQESAIPYSLVLCHQNREKLPVNTGKWKSLLSFDNHHHVVSNCRKDFERLARFLTGQTFGLVLGGGGARGLAHIGVLRALEEAEIPVDIICGTSIGAVISSLYAMGYSIEELTAVN
jgi:CRP-like cAMP-binding protein